MSNLPKGMATLFLIGILGLLILVPMASAQPLTERAYSDFVQDVQAGNVRHVSLDGAGLVASYTGGEQFHVAIPGDSRSMVDLLLQHRVDLEYARRAEFSWWGILFSIMLPLVVLGGLFWLLNSQGAGGGAGQVFSFGQSRARLYAAGDRPVTMSDVAGVPEAKEELWEVVDFLRSPERYRELGARIPRGVMLCGPPGTGKTLLARAVAGEAGVPFFSIAGSDFVEMFAGVGASRVRDLFGKARKYAPCIIFVDEIDAVGRQRGVSASGGSDEREQTLNQLLVEMDGFDSSENVIVMAATNRLDVLDVALMRPGRFDRQISVDPPDRLGRKAILEVHSRGKRMTTDVDLDGVAAMTTGFTGADLANLLNESALLAARRRKEGISMSEVRSAYERVVAGGPAVKRSMTPTEKRRIAFHEAGHALVSRHLTHADPIEKVTIVPQGRALGYVMYRPKEEKSLHSRSEIVDRMVSLLGGRAAEEALLGEVSTGAADDLERATGIARRMVTELGMSAAIGPVMTRTGPSPMMSSVGAARALSERTTAVVDVAVRELVAECYSRALDLVRRCRGDLEKVAHALLERESLDGSELDRLLNE